VLHFNSHENKRSRRKRVGRWYWMKKWKRERFQTSGVKKQVGGGEIEKKIEDTPVWV
jgi:hypothetical protein